MSQLIFHVDVNSAYLSWTAVKLLSEGRPDLRLIPSAIGGDKDKRKGIVVAKSIPAKQKGVKTGEPVGLALRKCPELVLEKPDFDLYRKCSARFMDICRKYAPALEKYSIDECFLDMSGTENIYPDPIALAYKIKDEIKNTLGFTVNIGISTNKILAKMASDFEKPDKVHTLFPAEIETKLWPLPVGDLLFVGSATAEKLRKSGIKTIGDLARSNIGFVKSVLGNKAGQMLHDYANGIDDSPVRTSAREAKGYSISYTYEEDITDKARAYREFLALTEKVSSRMRSDSVKAYCITVTIRDTSFKNKSHQKKLSQPTDITADIYKIVQVLFDELWDGKTPLRLLGVYLSDVVKTEYVQESLFDTDRQEKLRKLDKAVDSIRKRYGKDKLIRGSALERSNPDDSGEKTDNR